jgi:hypothetical protein
MGGYGGGGGGHAYGEHRFVGYGGYGGYGGWLPYAWFPAYWFPTYSEVVPVEDTDPLFCNNDSDCPNSSCSLVGVCL